MLRAGDACTRCFELSPSEATLDAVPGVLTVHWETTASASLKLPPAALELPLPPVRGHCWPPGAVQQADLSAAALQVAVAEPPLSVRTHVPAIFVVGAPITLCTTVQNRTSLAQELAVSVSDAPGFVFSGERTHTLEVRALTHASVAQRVDAYTRAIAPSLHRLRLRCCRTAPHVCATRSYRTPLAGSRCPSSSWAQRATLRA